MKIKIEFKKYCLLVAEIVIEEFFNQAFQNENQEILNQHATILQVCIEQTKKGIEKNEDESPIELSEDMVIYAIGKELTLFHVILDYFNQKVNIEKLTYHQIFYDWSKKKIEITEPKGIEKYLNTSDFNFNNNAYYWHIELRNNDLFEDLEIPFKILSEYLNFKYKGNKPISTIDKVDELMSFYKLSNQQQLFIYDKLNGLIANADSVTQDILALTNVEILDRRWKIEPLDLKDEMNNFNVNLILKESKKYETVEDQIAFLRKKQLDFKSENDETGYMEELIVTLQIDIDSLYLKLDKNAIPNELYFDKQFKLLNEENRVIIDSVKNLDTLFAMKLNELKDVATDAYEKIQISLDSIEESIFINDIEINKFFAKFESIIPETNTNKSEFEGWQNQPIKHKIKVTLPLILLKYEAEMDVSKFSFPKNWIELKKWFIK